MNELSALARGRSDLQAKLAAAQLELQKAKQAFVAGLPQSPEYQQRTKNLDAAIAAVETAQAAKDAKEMVRTATEKLDAQTDLNAITKRLEAADQGIINAAREIESLNQRLRKLTATEAKKQTELAAMEAQKLAEYWASEHGQTELLTRQVAAEQVSKEYILKFLKHPDDATFGFWDVPDIRSNSDRDVFYVSSKVKAKNDFGGELTYRWATIVFRNGDRWELVSCIIDNKSVYESEDLRSQLQKRAARK